MRCDTCGKDFSKQARRMRTSKRNFCNQECYRRFGKVRTAECHKYRPHHGKGLCKSCYDARYGIRNKKSREQTTRGYRERNPIKVRNSQLKTMYGITLEDFDRMYKDQDGLCAICHTREAKCVDHKHATKQVRQLLCKTCNQGIGLLRECPAILRSAAEYIEKWESMATSKNDLNTGPEVG